MSKGCHPYFVFVMYLRILASLDLWRDNFSIPVLFLTGKASEKRMAK